MKQAFRALVCATTLLAALIPLATPVSAAGFRVTSQGDDVDADPGDARCNAPGIFQGCTLRAAIMEINALDVKQAETRPDQVITHTITLQPGTYRLSRDDSGADDDGGDAGDLDVRARSVVINVEGGGSASIDVRPGDQGSFRRAFEIRAGSVVSIDRVSIRNGSVSSEQGPGGAILNNGTLALTNATLDDNRAASGGGIFNNGVLSLSNIRVLNNRADEGGGIVNNGTLTLSTSRVENNRAVNTASSVANGGGMLNRATRTATIVRSRIAGNTAQSGGGGLHNEGTADLDQVTIDSNRIVTNDSRFITMPARY